MSFSADWTQDGYDPKVHGFWKADTGEGNYGYPRNYYFADTMRSVSIAFGAMFSNLYVIRYDEKGYPRKRIQVPIKFGPTAKSHDYRTELEHANIDKNGVVDPKYYVQQPNLTWKFAGLSYDGARQTSTNHLRTFYDTYLMKHGVSYQTCELLWQDTQPIPWNITIEMQINTDHESDTHQLIESVVTKFRDGMANLYVKEFWFINLRRDLKISLKQCNWQADNDALTEEQKREFKPTFTFEIEANFYKPIENGDIITGIITTLNPHTAQGALDVFGIYGNAAKHEKYEDAATYAEAVSSHIFDGSLTNEYDFTNAGNVTLGPVSSISASYFSPEYEVKDGYIFYKKIYEYAAEPNTLKEYTIDDKVLTATLYKYKDIKGENGIHLSDILAASGLSTLANIGSINALPGFEHYVPATREDTSVEIIPQYVAPYSGVKYTNSNYGFKDYLDSSNDKVNTIYRTSSYIQPGE